MFVEDLLCRFTGLHRIRGIIRYISRYGIGQLPVFVVFQWDDANMQPDRRISQAPEGRGLPGFDWPIGYPRGIIGG